MPASPFTSKVCRSLAAALSCLAAGCGDRPPPARLTPLSEDAVVLIYAAGVGEEADFFRSTPMDEALRATLKRKVISAGQAGEYAQSALERLPAVLEQNTPDLVVLGYGAMDLWKKADRAKLKAAIAGMVDASRRSGAQVVMLALPDLNKLRLAPDPIFAEVAREKGVPIEAEVISST